MLKTNNGRNLVLKIKLFKPKCIMPFNKFLNKSKNKRPYHGLIQ